MHSAFASFSPALSTTANNNTTTYNNYQTYSLGYYITNPMPGASLPLMIESGITINWHHQDYSPAPNRSATEDIVSSKIPANLLMRIGLSPDFIISPYAGLFGKANLFGKRTQTYSSSAESKTETENLFDKGDMSGNPYKRILIGYNAGLRFQYSKYYAIIEYESSFTNLTYNSKYHLTSFGIGFIL